MHSCGVRICLFARGLGPAKCQRLMACAKNARNWQMPNVRIDEKLELADLLVCAHRPRTYSSRMTQGSHAGCSFDSLKFCNLFVLFTVRSSSPLSSSSSSSG